MDPNEQRRVLLRLTEMIHWKTKEEEKAAKKVLDHDALRELLMATPVDELECQIRACLEYLSPTKSHKPKEEEVREQKKEEKIPLQVHPRNDKFRPTPPPTIGRLEELSAQTLEWDIQETIAFSNETVFHVKSTLNWSDLDVKKSYRLSVSKNQAPVYGSVCCVLSGTLLDAETQTAVASVVLKFRNTWRDSDVNGILSMSRVHCHTALKNCNRLDQYLQDMKVGPAIQVVPTVLLRAECLLDRQVHKVNFWIEQKLDPFVHFRKPRVMDKRGGQKSKALSLVNTPVPILRQLQDFIYMQSNKKYTICDLQGARLGEDRYLLSDICFTHTMTDLGWSKQELLDAYLEDRSTAEKDVQKQEK